MKKDLYIDFDSTIVETEAAFCEVYNEEYSKYKSFKPADWKQAMSWIFDDVCPLIHVYHEDAQKEIVRIFGCERFFELLKPMDNAIEVLMELEEKYNLIICTSAMPENASRKVLWIEEHLQFVDEVIVLINKKQNGIGKGRVPMNEEGSIFIDDHPNNLISTNAARKILFKSMEKDFNKDWAGESVSHWDEVKAKLL